MKKRILLIPADRIKDIVDRNIIANAVPITGNAYMKYLWTIWYNYVEPGVSGDPDCMYCLNNIHGNFKSMQATIIEVYKEQQKLESL